MVSLARLHLNFVVAGYLVDQLSGDGIDRPIS